VPVVRCCATPDMILHSCHDSEKTLAEPHCPMFGGGSTRYREGGTRGGRDQFNWDQVKDDRFRDYYLGASVKLAKDKEWLAKTDAEAVDTSAREAELAAIREAERVYMQTTL
jgi:hypothetical protein